MFKRLISLLLCITLLAALLPASAEEALSLDALMDEIEEVEKGLTVSEVAWELSADRQSIYLNKPAITGGSGSYRIAYNIYDSNSNPVNYFYSDEERVAATPGYGGLFNVFVVVTDLLDGAQNTQDIGWQTLSWPYADVLTVGRAAFEVSPDRKSVFLTRPSIACKSGQVSIAYNIYDAQSRPVNYFYSDDTRVAATPGYAGKFNVFIVVTDLVTGEQDIQNIGWTVLGGDEPVPETGSLLVWASGAAQSLTEDLVSEFKQAHPEYAGWEITVEAVSEGDAATQMLTDVEAGADVFTFVNDQVARLTAAGALSSVHPSYEAVARANDAGAVRAASVSGKLMAYPITADNGYFLFYDKDVVTNPGDLAAILADCEAAGREFHMELISGWYIASFFFGAGCDLSYSWNGDEMIGFNGNVTGEAGLKAAKAAALLAASPAFVNNSLAERAANAAALVSGTWDGETVGRLWAHPGAAKLPAVNGMQLGSFGGYKLIGVKPQLTDARDAAAHALAAWLAGEQAQIRRQNILGWLASNPTARSRGNSSWYDAGLTAQAPYAVPQGMYPYCFWEAGWFMGGALIDRAPSGLTDAELRELLQEYQRLMEGG
ncbi:MAG: extracellular solute-binding protein [Clostridia bacterium]|nr:extracellular solute-binding protein [Clostridia bacterium]